MYIYIYVYIKWFKVTNDVQSVSTEILQKEDDLNIYMAIICYTYIIYIHIIHRLNNDSLSVETLYKTILFV